MCTLEGAKLHFWPTSATMSVLSENENNKVLVKQEINNLYPLRQCLCGHSAFCIFTDNTVSKSLANLKAQSEEHSLTD